MKKIIDKLQRNNFKAIIAWCIYDWGISAFPVIVTTFVIATYFTSKVAENQILGTHQWGNAMALAGIIIAIASPIFGSIANFSGHCKYWLAVFVLLLCISSGMLWYAKADPSYVNFTLICVVLGTAALNIGMVFYNALLVNNAPSHYIGRISGIGWGLGYFGGLAILFIALTTLVNSPPSWLDASAYEQIRLSGPLVALWIGLFSLPLFLLVKDYPSSGVKLLQAVKKGLIDLSTTLKSIRKEKNIFMFLIAQMIYIDGLNTLFAFGGIYAVGTFNMSLSEVLIFGIVLNAFAGVGSVLLGWVDDWIGPKLTILFSLILLTLLGLGIVLVVSKTQFWILTALLSLFIGPVQSSSRSLMAHLVPKEKATEIFGFYILSGKISTFLGPWLLAFTTLQFNSQRAGMASILLFFILGGIVLSLVNKNDFLKQ